MQLLKLLIRLCRAVVRRWTMWLAGWEWDDARGTWYKCITVDKPSIDQIARIQSTVNSERWLAHAPREAFISNISWDRQWAEPDRFEYVVRYDVRGTHEPIVGMYATTDFKEELP